MRANKADPVLPPHPSAGSLAALVALGATSALGFLFLWLELVLARSGGTAFCALDAATSCTAAWDSPFASQIHRLSGLPLAAWGLVWSLAAFLLPLLALLRQAEGRPQPALISATRLLAAIGIGAVAVMLFASAVMGVFCVGCLAADIAIAGYAGIALFSWAPLRYPQLTRAAMWAGGACAVGYLALLYPGLHTPKPAAEAGRAAVSRAAAPAKGTGDAERDQRLVEMVDSLDPSLKQTLSDALAIYRNSEPVAGPAPPRTKTAPVHITEWTDIRCEHCADLQQTLLNLQEQTPAGSFSVEARQFPLDGECNPVIERATDPVRCLAARARICLARNPKSDEFARALFARQKELTAPQLYQIAAPFMERKALESCVSSPETKAQLEEDIAYASRFASDGTPIVALNGRMGVSFPPFLYAMILTGGVAEHPAFASLPPPNPNAHLH